MKLGLFLEWPNAGGRPWAEAFRDAVAQVQLAEEAGFEFTLIAEHHFSDYSISPAPVLEASMLLRETDRMRIGTGVVVLPEWQPLRLAEEIAVADQLSGGRFIAGVGRGFVPFEQQRFGVDPADSRAAFEESLAVLLKALTEEDFTFEGRFVRVPQPTTVLPHPFQRPHPPLWLAGSSTESVELVGRYGMTPITSAALGAERLQAQRDAFLEARRRHGRADAPLEVVAQGQCYVAETPAELRAVLPAARWQQRSAPALLQQRVVRGVLDVAPLPDEPPDDALLSGGLIGTPEQVVRRLRALEAAGVTHTTLLMTFGGLEQERVLHAIRLLGDAVIPALGSGLEV